VFLSGFARTEARLSSYGMNRPDSPDAAQTRPQNGTQHRGHAPPGISRVPDWSCRLAFSIQEAGALLGISESTVRRLARLGFIRPTQALRKPLFARAELERFLSEPAPFRRPATRALPPMSRCRGLKPAGLRVPNTNRRQPPPPKKDNETNKYTIEHR